MAVANAEQIFPWYATRDHSRPGECRDSSITYNPRIPRHRRPERCRICNNVARTADMGRGSYTRLSALSFSGLLRSPAGYQSR